jgi:hypothetical protein
MVDLALMEPLRLAQSQALPSPVDLREPGRVPNIPPTLV